MFTYNFVQQAMAEEAVQMASTSQTTGSAAGSIVQEGSLMANLTPLLAIMAVFYFLLIRPQQRKMKEHQSLMKALKKGDRVLTMGGVVGVIMDDHDDSYVKLEIAPDVVVQIKRESIGEVLHKAGKEEDKAKGNAKTIKPAVVATPKDKHKAKGSGTKAKV